MATTVLRVDQFGQRFVIVTRDSGEQECFPEGHEQFAVLLPDATPAEEPADPGWSLWPGEFQALFTDTELVAIQTSTDANVIRFRTMIQTFVSPILQSDPRVLPALMLLESLEILATARRERVYSGQMPE